MSKMPLDKILQSQGMGTRKSCRMLIEEGDVCVHGLPVVDWRTEFETEQLQFSVSGQGWKFREHIYVALNKPEGYECSRRPTHHSGVLTLLPIEMLRRGIQPVGRLDHDTTGLLLLSDDGGFIHEHTSPKRHVPKVYQAKTQEPVDESQVGKLLKGVLLHDEKELLAALSCRLIGERELEMTLTQGKYHQVRRMLAAVGNHCRQLHRSAIGGLMLETLNLSVGEWCYLSAEEMARLHHIESSWSVKL